MATQERKIVDSVQALEEALARVNETKKVFRLYSGTGRQDIPRRRVRRQ